MSLFGFEALNKFDLDIRSREKVGLIKESITARYSEEITMCKRAPEFNIHKR